VRGEGREERQAGREKRRQEVEAGKRREVQEKRGAERQERQAAERRWWKRCGPPSFPEMHRQQVAICVQVAVLKVENASRLRW